MIIGVCTPRRPSLTSPSLFQRDGVHPATAPSTMTATEGGHCTRANLYAGVGESSHGTRARVLLSNLASDEINVSEKIVNHMRRSVILRRRCKNVF